MTYKGVTEAAAPVPVPDVGDLFDYDGRGFRCDGWVRIEERTVTEQQAKIFALLCVTPPKLVRRWALREEATHVVGSGVSGCIAAIESVTCTGRVNWEEKVIAEYRAQAVALGRSQETIPFTDTSPVAPDIGDIVSRIGASDRRWRVVGWLKKVPRPLSDDPIMMEIEAEDPSTEAEVWVRCLRDDATHVLGSGISGLREEICQLKVVGRFQGPPQWIAEWLAKAIDAGKNEYILGMGKLKLSDLTPKTDESEVGMNDQTKAVPAGVLATPLSLAKFPDFGPLDVDLPLGLVDTSSSGDECPSFELRDHGNEDEVVLKIFVDFEVAARRTREQRLQTDGRFTVYAGNQLGEVGPADLVLETDSWDEVVAAVELRRPFPGFEADGMWITNPTVSDCSRFNVSPEAYGFEIESTGGSGTAFTKKLPDGRRISVTNVDGMSHELGEVGSTFLIALVSNTGEQLSIHHGIVGDLSSRAVDYSGAKRSSPGIRHG